MKFIIVQCEETVDITVIPKGTAVTVADGTNTLNGEIAGSLDYVEPDPPPVVPHIHDVSSVGVTGHPQ